jgi:hypothetical protein
MMRKILLSLALLLSLLSLPLFSVSAHRPGWGEDEGVTEIPNLRTSFAFYRVLEAAPPGSFDPTQDTHDLDSAAQFGYIHLYRFEAQAGQNLYGGINIPSISGLEDYAVSLALVGPGLPLEDVDALPLAVPEEGLGAVIFPTQVSEDFFEPFTLTRYWGRQSMDLELPESGPYFLVVWNPDGQPGKYVMDTGRAEEFSPGDIFRFPVWWVQVHLFFEHGPALAAAAGLLALLIGSVLWKRRPLHPTTR